jgi:hypothetical protein
MTEIRFQIRNATKEDYDRLASCIQKEVPEARFPGGAPAEGAALVTILLAAIITGGATLVGAGINAYANYQISQRKPLEKNDPPPAPIILVIRGTEGTANVEISADEKTNKAAIDAAMKQVGTPNEVTTRG